MSPTSLLRRAAFVLSVVVASVGLAGFALAPAAASTPVVPTSVTVAGDFQSELGCGSDWDPGCGDLSLADGGVVWVGTVGPLPAGDYQYKIAVDHSWDINYGAGGVAGGPNMSFHTDGGDVTFVFDPRTGIAQSSAEEPIVTIAGDFQSELGCSGDWNPGCLLSLAEDGDRDGVYTTTVTLPAGDYDTKVAYNLGWDENYGAGGVAGGANIPFTVPVDGTVTFTYSLSTHILEITTPSAPPPPAVAATSTLLVPTHLLVKGGATLAVTVHVRAHGGGSPIGTVTVTDRTATVATAVLGTATHGSIVLTLPPMARGLHVLRASFVGDPGWQNSVTTIPIPVIAY
jgi:hypothetical protein